MKLSEKKSYLLALVIVISGTLVITAGFTIGLLSLARQDHRVVDPVEAPEGELIEEIKFENKYDYLIGEYPSENETPDELKLDEYLLPSDDIFEISPKTKKTAVMNAANRSVKKGKWILIDKNNFTLTLYDKDEELHEWEIAVGSVSGDKQHKGDNRTPSGSFRIRQIQDSSKWTYDFGDGNGQTEGVYGPWFIRLHTPPWSGIGIHGTHKPDTIGSRASEGCIRMKNEELIKLKGMVSIGMPVVIIE
ncbi:MAG: L,D-transpeptidase [Synergistaceae bacterium]|nr:L,D-transpeptidase [Synergistaceae bacterium]